MKLTNINVCCLKWSAVLYEIKIHTCKFCKQVKTVRLIIFHQKLCIFCLLHFLNYKPNRNILFYHDNFVQFVSESMYSSTDRILSLFNIFIDRSLFINKLKKTKTRNYSSQVVGLRKYHDFDDVTIANKFCDGGFCEKIDGLMASSKCSDARYFAFKWNCLRLSWMRDEKVCYIVILLIKF